MEARAPIVLDGALDEEVWRPPSRPRNSSRPSRTKGSRRRELTEVRLAFDRDALYIGVVCHDTDPSGIIVNDIRKDFAAGEQDTFEVLLDTFADRRNGFVFVTNAAGAKADTQIANEGRDVNTSWDAVWTVATRRDAGGWTAEIRIPFKTLRFERGSDRVWGINFSRRIRRKNEIDYWSPVPRVYNLYRAGLAGTLTGLPDASQGRNLRIKPWVAADATRASAARAFDARRARRPRPQVRRHAVADARRHRRSPTSRRPRPTSSRSTSRSSASSSRRSASSSSRTPACSTSATSRASRGSATRASRRRKKRCCCSSAGGSA